MSHVFDNFINVGLILAPLLALFWSPLVPEGIIPYSLFFEQLVTGIVLLEGSWRKKHSR